MTTTRTIKAYDDLNGVTWGTTAYIGELVASGDEVMLLGNYNSISPTASTTYYFGQGQNDFGTGTENNLYEFIYPKTGTVSALYAMLYIGGTTPTSEAATFTLRKNGADTSVVISSGWDTQGSNGAVLTSTGSASVTAGDKGSIKLVTPAWVTAPTGVRLMFAFTIS